MSPTDNIFVPSWKLEMAEHLPSRGAPVLNDAYNTRFIAYILDVHPNGNVTYFSATSRDFFIATRPAFTEELEIGHLYSLEFSPRTGQGLFSTLSPRVLLAYLNRERTSYVDTVYHSVFIRSLILGKRVVDYRRYAATITDVDEEHLTIRLPRSRHLQEPRSDAIFISEAGDMIDVVVNQVVEAKEHLELHVTLKDATISGLLKNFRLLYYAKQRTLPPDHQVLQELYQGTRSISNRRLLDRLCGEAYSFNFPKVDETIVTIRARNGQVINFNGAQSEVVRTYVLPVENCPAFGVVGCPGSGKSLVLAVMAVTYCQHGLPGMQLLLAPNRIALNSLEQAMYALDTTNIRILRIEELDDLGASPFSIMNNEDKENNPAIGLLQQLKQELLRARGEREQHAIRELMADAYAGALAAAGPQDILLSTIDKALEMILEKKNYRGICQQLKTSVARVGIDEANQVPEATLTALIHSFSDKFTPMFVAVGDPLQMGPPGDIEGDIACILAGINALEVFQRRHNVPIIKLRETFRHPAHLMPYASLYDDRIMSTAPRKRRLAGLDLTSLSPRTEGVFRSCVLIDVAQWEAIKSGDSFINDFEINALVRIVKWLREEGRGMESILIISLCEAQRRLAIAHLPFGYEVVTIEETQGREADVVIVLTTMDEASAMDAVFSCPRRCVLASTRQKQGLILIGNETVLASTEPWRQLLERGFFYTVEHDDENDDDEVMEESD